MLFLLLFCLAVRVSTAGDFESLHVANANLDFSKRVTIQLHSRLRTNHNVRQFYQARGGPILLIQQNAWLQWLGGYYYIGQETNAKQLFDQHRVFGGAQARIWQDERRALDWRNAMERHFGGPVEDFWRYRSRMMLAGKSGSRWQPYGSVEGLLAKSTWTARVGAGIGFSGSEGRQFLIGYEWRQYLTGPASHILTTTLQFPAWRSRSLEDRGVAHHQGIEKTARMGK